MKPGYFGVVPLIYTRKQHASQYMGTEFAYACAYTNGCGNNNTLDWIVNSCNDQFTPEARPIRVYCVCVCVT